MQLDLDPETLTLKNEPTYRVTNETVWVFAAIGPAGSDAFVPKIMSTYIPPKNPSQFLILKGCFHEDKKECVFEKVKL